MTASFGVRLSVSYSAGRSAFIIGIVPTQEITVTSCPCARSAFACSCT